MQLLLHLWGGTSKFVFLRITFVGLTYLLAVFPPSPNRMPFYSINTQTKTGGPYYSVPTQSLQVIFLQISLGRINYYSTLLTLSPSRIPFWNPVLARYISTIFAFTGDIITILWPSHSTMWLNLAYVCALQQILRNRITIEK